ncbi:MAG: hypothetical protein KF688_00750 [Pirellulales bacterium]|nr:hypothetical protein [Pirellulales bacterium]
MRAPLVVVSIGLAVGAGCSPTYFRMPRLLSPGSAPRQRAAAEVSDPYPLPDVGPPIVGGRPLEYAVPVDPTRRATDYNDSRLAPSVPIPIGPPLGSPFGGYPGAAAPMTQRY